MRIADYLQHHAVIFFETAYEVQLPFVQVFAGENLLKDDQHDAA